MPWKGEKDPYRIWLSEVILQQTRVEQGLKYYQSFIRRYPTVQELAAAPDQEVFRLWEGLGYYSRCRNLLAAAREVVERHSGVFPASYEALLHLKGVGAYTAAAIASFAFGLPHAVLDGNVYRVLARIHAIQTPSDTAEGKKLFTRLVTGMLPGEPARFNQAIMDFGATVCKPVPVCETCFFKAHCKAYQEEKQLLFPVKLKRIRKKERWFNYIILRHKDRYAIRQRKEGDIWQNLYEFILLETPSSPTQKMVTAYVGENFKEAKPTGNSAGVDQQLTHQHLHFRFYQFITTHRPASFLWVKKGELSQYAFPKTLRAFIETELI